MNAGACSMIVASRARWCPNAVSSRSRSSASRLRSRDHAGGPGDRLDRAVRREHGREDVLVVPGHAGRAGVRRLVHQHPPRVDDLLYLALELGGEVVRVLQVEEVPPDRLFQRQPPQVQQRLVHVHEPPVAVEDVGEVVDVREGRVEHADLPLGPRQQFPPRRLAPHLGGRLGDGDEHARDPPGVVPGRAVGDGEVRVLDGRAVPRDREQGVLQRHRLAAPSTRS